MRRSSSSGQLVLVHAQVDDAVGEARVAAVALDHEQRRRLLAAPVAARGLCRVEAVEQPLDERRACGSLERLGDRVDGLGGDEDVALGRVARPGAAAGPVHALRAGVARAAALAVDHAELPVVAAVVGLRQPLDDLLRAQPSRSSASPSGP